MELTPLHCACDNNHLDTVSIILDRGADIEMTDSVGDVLCLISLFCILTEWLPCRSRVAMQSGKTLLERASSRDQGRLVSYLRDRGAKYTLADKGHWV